MSIATALPPGVKSSLRPYVHAMRRMRASAGQWADDVNLQGRIWGTKLKRVFVGVPLPAAANGKLNLHLGCGGVNHPEFINIDGYPFPHVHYVQTIDRLPRFATGTVDLIYASHCLEHFRYHETRKVLQEWGRVLKPGGVLRISVPDFDKLVDIFLEHRRDPDVIIEQLMGGQNNKYNFHYTALNKANLSRMLLASGFATVRDWTPGVGPLTTFPDFSVYRKDVEDRSHEISLNIEAVKG